MSYKTGRIKHGPNATIIDVDVKNPEIEDIPNDQLELVETKTTQKVVRVSSPFAIVNVHSKTYRRKDDLEEIVPPEVPEVFENSIYDVSFLAGYFAEVDHLCCAMSITRTGRTRSLSGTATGRLIPAQRISFHLDFDGGSYQSV